MERHGNLQKHLNPNPFQQFLLKRFHQKITNLVNQTGVTYMLDAGCGEGFVADHLHQCNSNLTIVGGDYSVDSLLWGRNNTSHETPLTNLDIYHLPFADDSFPLTMCLEVLEHLPDSTIGLRELVRVSSDYILLSVPHEPWFRGVNFVRGKHFSDFGNDPEHLHNYSGRMFRRMVGNVVKIVWHGYVFPWQIVLARKQK